MHRIFAKFLASALAVLVAVPLVLVPVPVSARESAAKAATFSKEQLDQILAPIALYPDDLLSNVLVAATYPLEVVQAARWIEEPAHARLKGDALTAALNDQDWDPSVKSLTQFPDVLAMMSKQLDWTQKLGDAFLASQADVMDRIQFLRDRAEAAGNLKSNKYRTVTTQRSGGGAYIDIEPAEPDVVYVPVYEPAVYGDWWYPDYPPYYWPADGAYEDDYYWGAGIAIFPPLWGWWAPRWGGHYIHVDVDRYNRFNHNRHKIGSNRWRHDHRRDAGTATPGPGTSTFVVMTASRCSSRVLPRAAPGRRTTEAAIVPVSKSVTQPASSTRSTTARPRRREDDLLATDIRAPIGIRAEVAP